MLNLKKNLSILLNAIVVSLPALFVSESTIAALGEPKDSLVSAEDDLYEYKLTHKATAWSGVVGVLDIADKKTKKIVYHEEGLPFKHVCEGNKSIFTEYKVTQQSTPHEVMKQQFMFFCATDGGRYSVLAVFSQGSLSARIQTVESPEIIHKYDNGAMHFKIGHRYPLLDGSIGRFYEIFDFDPWGFNSARFMPSYDEIAIQEYKKLFLEMAEAVKRDANKQRFYLEPMLSVLTSIGDANLTCSSIESGALAFATPEQIKSAIVSNAGRGYPYFNAAICTK